MINTTEVFSFYSANSLLLGLATLTGRTPELGGRVLRVLSDIQSDARERRSSRRGLSHTVDRWGARDALDIVVNFS